MSVTSKEINKASWILFRFAEVLEEYAELPDKNNSDRFFALEWASECHKMDSKIKKWYEEHLIDDIIEDAENKIN